jgi:hypothetical protein
MKKIRELVKGRLGKYVIFLLLAYPAVVGAQIGYRYVRGTGTAGSQTCWSDTFTLDDCSASESLDGTGTANIVAKFTDADTLGDSDIVNEGTPAAGLGGEIVNIGATTNAMNGSDTIVALIVDVTGGNHTGTSNTLDIISTNTLTGDANSNLNAINVGALTGTTGAAGELEIAIKIGNGWDYLLFAGGGIAFADLGTPALGHMVYCSNCAATSTTSDVCTSTSGNGTFAFRIRGASGANYWSCIGNPLQ